MKNLVAHIENRLYENKQGFKTYASYQFANAKGENLSKQIADEHGQDKGMDYMPVFLPNYKRWTIVFLQSSWMNSRCLGGYVGQIGDAGFLSV